MYIAKETYGMTEDMQAHRPVEQHHPKHSDAHVPQGAHGAAQPTPGYRAGGGAASDQSFNGDWRASLPPLKLG